MYYDKEKYEKLISESVLFSMNLDRESSVYKRESYKMLEYIYCYLMAVSEEKYEQFACEIIEVATRCINNFNNSKGAFLHYFNAAWKQEYLHLMGDQILDSKLRGITVTEEERRNIRKYIKLVGDGEMSCTREELYQRISEAMQLPFEKVRLIAELSNIRVTGDTIKDENGKETNLWELFPDETVSVEDELSSADSIDELLKKVETAFLSLQDRQKPIVSDMITARIWSLLSERHVASYTFISKDIVDCWKKTGRVPSQRAIAKKHKKDEASISRTLKAFVEKLKNNL